MFNLSNPVAPLVKMQMEAWRQYADAMFAGVDTMSRAALSLAHQAFAEQMKSVHALALVQALQPAERFGGKPALGASATPLDYQNDALRIISTMQKELSKSMSKNIDQTANAMKSASHIHAHAKERIPAIPHDEIMRNPLENLVGIWSAVYNDLSRAAAENMRADTVIGSAQESGIRKGMHDQRISHIHDRRVTKARDRRSASSRAH
ncbi:MAG: phasin family protein [Herminiimonas sp.]|nr:phasin family protein [Herminiimonas sp.]